MTEFLFQNNKNGTMKEFINRGSLIFLFSQKYSLKSENIIGLDSYILNSLNYLNLIWLYISHCMTSLLKLEITV